MAILAKRLFRRPHPPALPPEWAGSPPTYRPRRPTATPLYPVVQHHLETFLAQAAEADPLGHALPYWVERDFRDLASRGAPSAAASSPTALPERVVTTAATSA